MKINRVAHIAIAVRDLDEGKRTFASVFGLEPSLEQDHAEYDVRMAMYDMGNAELELMQGPATTPFVGRWLAGGDGLFHVCLEVDDLEAAVAELRGRGVKLLTDMPLQGHSGAPIAFLDPDCTGNVLFELVQAAQPAADAELPSE